MTFAKLNGRSKITDAATVSNAARKSGAKTKNTSWTRRNRNNDQTTDEYHRNHPGRYKRLHDRLSCLDNDDRRPGRPRGNAANFGNEPAQPFRVTDIFPWKNF